MKVIRLYVIKNNCLQLPWRWKSNLPKKRGVFIFKMERKTVRVKPVRSNSSNVITFEFEEVVEDKETGE